MLKNIVNFKREKRVFHAISLTAPLNAFEGGVVMCADPHKYCYH